MNRSSVIASDHPLADRIRGLVPINGLDPRLQGQALAQGELLEFKRRKTVFEAGARDPYTFYLIDGELELQAAGASPLRMKGGDENARRAIAQLQPRRYTAVTLSNVTVFRIQRAVLDHILADEQTLEESRDGTVELREIEEDEGDWMTRLLSSALFMRLPHDNIQRFFAELEPVEAAEGDVIVEQGTDGDYLYIIAEGRCAVMRRAPGGGQEVQLAVLKEGDTFGDEALISNSPRNATVRMVSDGMLMRLAKPAFEELVTKPTLKALAWSEATQLTEEGAQWLDVRFADEHAANAIEGSINMPLNVLRLQVGRLDTDTTYIVYCDTGARSSAGAFLMLRLGFDACYLAGGLERSPLPHDPPTTPAKDPALEPEAAAESAAVAAAAAAMEFEFVSGDGTAAEDDDAGVSPVDEDPSHGDAAAPPATEDTTPATAEPAPAAPAEALPKSDQALAPPAAAPAPRQEAAAAPSPAAPNAAPAAAQISAEIARARQILTQLKAERDKATAFGQKAADAARELKRRNDELTGAINQERARREQVEKEMGALRADAERAESLEQARLKGELEKSNKRHEALQAELADEQHKAAEALEKVRAEGAENAQRLKTLTAEKEQAEEARVASEVAFQESLRETTEKSEQLERNLEKLRQELTQTQQRLAEAEAEKKALDADRLAQTSEIKIEIEQARVRVEAAKEELEQARARHAGEVERITAEHEATRTELRAQRAELDQAVAAHQARAEELDRREMDLSEARSSVDADLAEREREIARREESLAQSEASLSSEKESWNETVEKAIVEERERLENDYNRFREESEADLQRRAEALAAERIEERLEAQSEELRAAHEARESDMRTQVESHVAKLLAEFDERLAKVRKGYETRLNEQETLLEDERRRLETEIVRLREALSDARGSIRTTSPATPSLAPAASGTEAALDLRMNETAAAASDLTIDPADLPGTASPAAAPDLSLQPEPAPLRAAPPAASPGPDLDLEIEEPEPTPAPVPPAAGPAPAESVIPIIEVPQEEPEPLAERKKKEKDQRVISSDQIADIRKRMQEKMRAAKSRAG